MPHVGHSPPPDDSKCVRGPIASRLQMSEMDNVVTREILFVLRKYLKIHASGLTPTRETPS